MPASTSNLTCEARIAPSIGQYDPLAARGASGSSAHDGVRHSDIDEIGVHVIALGTALPAWAEPTTDPLTSDDVELVIMSDEDAVRAAWSRLLQSRPTAPALQLVVHAENEGADSVPLDRRCATVAVSVNQHDRDTVAYALAACAHGGELLIGTHAADLRKITGVDLGQVVRGRAIVINALGDAVTALAARETIADLTAAGYDVGRLMFQFVGQPDAIAFSLTALDACTTVVIAEDVERDWILSCAFADRTALVLVAFGRPTPISMADALIGAAD